MSLAKFRCTCTLVLSVFRLAHASPLHIVMKVKKQEYRRCPTYFSRLAINVSLVHTDQRKNTFSEEYFQDHNYTVRTSTLCPSLHHSVTPRQISVWNKTQLYH